MPDADDELPGRAVVLHVVVGLPDLLEPVVDAVYRERQAAGRTPRGRYSLGEKSRTVYWLERLPPKQAGFSGVGTVSAWYLAYELAGQSPPMCTGTSRSTPLSRTAAGVSTTTPSPVTLQLSNK
jgi:hypothetical protein